MFSASPAARIASRRRWRFCTSSAFENTLATIVTTVYQIRMRSTSAVRVNSAPNSHAESGTASSDVKIASGRLGVRLKKASFSSMNSNMARWPLL